MSIQYAEMAYAVRRRRADTAAEERVRLSEQLREIQSRLTWHEAWVRFEAPEVGAAYDELVARTRTVAGQSMKDAWRSAPVADDTAMGIPTSVIDLRALADVRERYMAAVEAHLRPRGRARRPFPRPRRAMPPRPCPLHRPVGRPPVLPAARRETKYTRTPVPGRHWPWTHVITDALERLALLPNPG